MLEFRLLGTLEVYRDGQPVPIPGRNARALLALLLIRAGEVISTDRLVHELWGEAPPRTAVASLQNAVSQLRRALVEDVVETRPGGYALRVDPARIDTVAFERGLAAARGKPAEERARELRAALALWHGPAAGGPRLRVVRAGEIFRLEDLRLAALEERLDADLERGRHADVVGELEGLAQEHPLRERVRAMLMLALYRSGRQADALAVYQDTRHALVDGLGIEPGHELQRLHGQILRHDVAAAVASRPVAAPDLEEEIGEALLAGRVVPVLGLPGGGALAARLATAFGFPLEDAGLPRVSQYVATMLGAGPLYDALHEAFATDDVPDAEHRLIARLPAALRAAGVENPLVVTTRFDLALERAFADEGEPSMWSRTSPPGGIAGASRTSRPVSSRAPIDVPNSYAGLSFAPPPDPAAARGTARRRSGAPLRELPRDRGRPHRVPRQRRPRHAHAGDGRRAPAPQPPALPRLPALRLGRAARAEPHLGRSLAVPLVGRTARGRRRWSASSGASGASTLIERPVDELVGALAARLGGRRVSDARRQPVPRARAVRGLRRRRALFFGRAARGGDRDRQRPRHASHGAARPSGVGKSSLARAGVAHALRVEARAALAGRAAAGCGVVAFAGWQDADPRCAR